MPSVLYTGLYSITSINYNKNCVTIKASYQKFNNKMEYGDGIIITLESKIKDIENNIEVLWFDAKKLFGNINAINKEKEYLLSAKTETDKTNVTMLILNASDTIIKLDNDFNTISRSITTMENETKEFAVNIKSNPQANVLITKLEAAKAKFNAELTDISKVINTCKEVVKELKSAFEISSISDEVIHKMLLPRITAMMKNLIDEKSTAFDSIFSNNQSKFHDGVKDELDKISKKLTTSVDNKIEKLSTKYEVSTLRERILVLENQMDEVRKYLEEVSG